MPVAADVSPSRTREVALAAGSESQWALIRRRFLHHRLAVASLCSVLVTTILDYQFKVAIQQRDPSAQGIATFLGGFYTATNLVALAMQVVVTRWALTTLGASHVPFRLS